MLISLQSKHEHVCKVVFGLHFHACRELLASRCQLSKLILIINLLSL